MALSCPYVYVRPVGPSISASRSGTRSASLKMNSVMLMLGISTSGSKLLWMIMGSPWQKVGGLTACIEGSVSG